MSKKLIALLVGLLMLAACTPNEGGPAMTPDPATAPPETEAKNTDYTYFWWNYGMGSYLRNAYVQTGNYGMMLDARTGDLKHLGGLKGYSREEVSSGSNDAVDALPTVAAHYGLTDSNGLHAETYAASYVHNDAYPMSGAYQEGPGKVNAVRIISSGQYMQRFDIMQLLFKDTDEYTARAEFACTANYMTLTYDAQAKNKQENPVTLTYTLDPGADYRLQGVYHDGTAAILRREDGQSLAMILPPGSKATLTAQDGKVSVSASITLAKRSWNGFSFVVMPGLDLDEGCILDYYAAQSVQISAQSKEPKDSGNAKVELNTLTSAHEITMPDSSHFTDYTVEANRTAYERTPFTVTNPSDRDIRVTLCFVKPKIFPYANYGLWGMSPMLVDPKTNEPTGIFVQYSRNPHNYISFKEVLYGSCWCNCYVDLEIPAHGSVSYDFVCAFSGWGETYASSIAQMCLVGWGGNQWWMSASLSSSPGYGETFGFDPERGCGRSLIDDSSAIFTSTNYSAGGGDWLSVYSAGLTGGYRSIRNQKITVKTVGPNVSQMKVTGTMDNGAVYAEFLMTISRSNDYARMINTCHYEFRKDLEFSRMALYQLGADNYNSLRFEHLTYGDASGAVETLNVPPERTDSAYLKQYVDMPGENVWVIQTDFVDNASDKGMAVREYRAHLNGKDYTVPTLSFFITNNGCTNLNAELSLPKEVGESKVVQAGSTVDLTVEYVMLPRAKSDYTGTSPYLKSLDASLFGNSGQMQAFACNAALSVSASAGTVLGTYPICVQTVREQTAAEITVTGGIGYVPVTFEGLDSYSGYRLFKVTDGGEEMVDQSVKGNDYWQVYHDPDTDLYDISFNVFQIGESVTYRLKKVG